jgi:uncharacterized lipoprotein YmbA
VYRIGLLAVTILTLLLSACFGGSRSLSPDYYLLTSRLSTSSQAQTVPAPTAAFSIGVGPVRVAPFLARQQIVIHEGSGAMKMQVQRWGEPLEQGIQRVLLQNLTSLTGAQSRGFPWRQNTAPDYALRVDVTDLDRLSDNKAILEVSWVLEDLKNRRVVTTQQTRFTTTISGGDRVALTNAYSDLFAQLAQHVQKALEHSLTSSASSP